MSKPTSIDEYLAGFPTELRSRLAKLHAIIQSEAANADEVINYGIPTFKLMGKNLVHFAAYKNHIGFYPSPSGIEAFEAELTAYKTSKGAVQFPHDKPLPSDLIARIVRFRVNETLNK